jgi:hypothetical protein
MPSIYSTPKLCARRSNQLDAAAAYGDLDDFRITIAWHIDYELLDAMRDAGWLHCVIDARSGKTLAKRYEQ